ncbi:MAG: hypothetical protein HOP28_11905 [Gemmatimonadales bacterium]|nr:hypothetical protein [Gemmatimonadales bacterium]
MTATRYRGFDIQAWPYRLHESTRWAIDLEILRDGRKQAIEVSESFQTLQEARARSVALGRKIIDGTLRGRSLRDRSPGWPALAYSGAILLGLVVLGLGAFILVQ